jgi:hypothetical protein
LFDGVCHLFFIVIWQVSHLHILIYCPWSQISRSDWYQVFLIGN